ncbi:MAG: metal ABC transporter ATP-binding protein [Patescibacteria group bacterium]
MPINKMQNDFILKVNELNVELNNEKIIEDLSFEVKEGEVLTILGPNGAGKTVLFKALIGLLPFKGKIEWKKGIKLGYVPQRIPLIKNIPLNVKEFFGLKGVSRQETEMILGSVGMGEKEILEKKVGDLSSGQFQRILIAFGLVSDPQVLLFDEPMAGIDIGGEETIYSLLDKLKKGRSLTILLITHDLNIVYKFATNVLCLNKKALCYGLPKKILTADNLARLYGEKIKFYSHTHD